MEFVNSEVGDLYRYWVKRVPQEHERGPHFVSTFDVLRAHFLIADYFIEQGSGVGNVGPRDVNLLVSAVHRQHTEFGGVRKWSSDFERCATLLYGLVKDHPFHDANKRTALLTTLYFLQICNRIPSVGQRELEDFVVNVAESGLGRFRRFSEMSAVESHDAEVRFIADYLKRKTRAVDRSSHVLTFKDLQRILNSKFSAGLENPSGNHIDVMSYRPRGHLSRIWSGEKVKAVRVVRIGFPGWKNQVSPQDIKLVRTALELTPQKGVDSAAFYGSAAPLNVLIDQYQGPLKRLADR